MLFRESVAEDTLELLEKISALTRPENFYLAGGTSLSLQIENQTILIFFGCKNFK